jgi:hypothetical protein
MFLTFVRIRSETRPPPPLALVILHPHINMGNTDSKTQLHTALIKVASETIPADQDLLWSSFWQLPTSTEIIFSALTGNELHDLRNKQPDNYVTLIRKVIIIDW